MKLFYIFIHLLIIVFLTVLTQVGGIVWILTMIISSYYKKKKRFIFPILYLAFNLLIIPPIASQFGRVKLASFNENLASRNLVYPLFFRNYVTLELYTLLVESSKELKKSEIKITYLDANFPFYNGFPLLPHLSHNDGKKIDIAFMYKDKDGKTTQKKPSLSGYGVYVNSNNSTTTNCLNKGYWQYDFPKYLTFGTINKLDFDERQTKILIEEFLKNSQTQKIFIEPYLKTNLGLNTYHKIRFHGCQAVRHDDHIHLQIK